MLSERALTRFDCSNANSAPTAAAQNPHLAFLGKIAASDGYSGSASILASSAAKVSFGSMS
jgi:hypothetical protein